MHFLADVVFLCYIFVISVKSTSDKKYNFSYLDLIGIKPDHKMLMPMLNGNVHMCKGNIGRIFHCKCCDLFDNDYIYYSDGVAVINNETI